MKCYSWDLDKLFTNDQFEKIMADILNKKHLFTNLTIEEKEEYKRRLIKYYTFCNLKLYINKNNPLYLKYKNKLDEAYRSLVNIKESNKISDRKLYLTYLEKISNRKFLYQGKTISYNDVSYSKNLNSKDRNYRKSVFIDYLENLLENHEQLTTLFTNLKKNQSYFCPLHFDKIKKLLEDMVPLFNSYFEMKKKILKLDNIFFYDLFTNEENEKVEYQQAKKIVKNSLSVLHLEEIMDFILENNWIDVYPKKKKTDGYFTIKSYDMNPYILLNYHNTYKDLFLLTHEIGHSATYFLRKKNKTYLEMKNFDDMEIPSLVHELLTAYYLLDDSSKTIMNLLDIIVNNFYRYGMFSVFENKFCMALKENQQIDGTSLYGSIKKKYFPKITILENEKYEYLKVKHFLNNNYCYKYAISCVIAISIIKKINQEKNYTHKYIKFLKQAELYDDKAIKEYLEIDLDDKDVYLSFKKEIENLISELGKIYENV